MILRDTVGACFGLWPLGIHSGAQLFNQPVSLTFNHLMTRQPELAKRFYTNVFRWDARATSAAMPSFEYFFHGVRAVAGMIMNAQLSPEIDSQWITSFAVADTDGLAARVSELGGSVLRAPTDSPFGRVAMMSDPLGAICSIVEQTPEVRAAAQTLVGVLS